MRIRPPFASLLVLCFILLGAQGLRAQCLLTLRPGPTDGKDMMVFGMNCNSSWTMSNGTCDTSHMAHSPRNFAAAWTWWGDPGILRSFMEFDLDSLANLGCSVGNATLYLFPDPAHFEYNCGYGSTLHPCNDNSFVVARVTQPWTETGTNWLNQPPVAGTLPGIDYVISPNSAAPYDPVTVNLTDMVNFWLANPTANFGFRYALQNEIYYSRLQFCSSDHPNVALRPRLVLSLNCPGDCDRLVEGDIYYDADANCNFAGADQPLQNWLVEITPGPYYATTDAQGHWSAWVGNASTYTINQYIPNHGLWDSICPLPYVRTVTGLVSGSVLGGQDFAVDADMFCAQPTVDIVTGFLRPCHVSPVTVQYCNQGNDSLLNAVVTVTADPNITFLTSTLPWVQPQSGLAYVFSVGDLGPGDCGSFTIDGQVSCNAVIGEAICVEAEISPLDSCVFTPIDTLWDRSSVSVDGDCVNDSLACFTITNTGSPSNGNMLAPSQYRIYDNGNLVYTGTFQLCGGCDTTICWPSAGHTIRLEADQRPGHPGNSHPNANVEECGTDGQGNVWRGFVTAMSQDDDDDHVEIYCDVVVNSYDPNDKLSSPSGLGAAHLTEPDAELEYTIRFQNTGTAPAIDITILDTLTTMLDIATVQPGAASFPYSYRIFGHGILEFKFLGINLPDSATNEPASHGFVKFRVRQAQGLPLGSRIENTASIYFDNNDPVLTPIAFNTIGLETAAAEPVGTQFEGLTLYPNPARDRVQLSWKQQTEPVTVRVVDLAGRTLLERRASAGNGIALDVAELPAAVYFVKVETARKRSVMKFVKQ